METINRYRKLACVHARILVGFRPGLASALKHLRCGYVPKWFEVHMSLRFMDELVWALQACAEFEIWCMNAQRPPDKQLKTYRKPRFYKKKAMPKPRAISLADQETFLEGLLRWCDAIIPLTDSPPGECYPHLPPGLKAVLQRNGFDPHHHLSPMRLVKEYLR